MEKELIYESKKSKLYRLDSSEWGKPALLKILNHEFPTPFEITQFYNEFERKKVAATTATLTRARRRAGR